MHYYHVECEGACFQVNAIEVTDVDELTSTKSSTIVSTDNFNC